jgi:hypothetical protein
MAYVQGHPDAPDNAMHYLARYESGRWHLLEPAVDIPYVRRDGARFDCADGVVTRYDTDGHAEQVAMLNADSFWCDIESASQERVLVEHNEELTIFSLNGGGAIAASDGLLREEDGELTTINEVFDTDRGLFLTVLTQVGTEMVGKALMRWDASASRWVEVAPPPLESGSDMRAFDASRTTVYASTTRAIWRLDGAEGDWTKLVDWDRSEFQHWVLDAWNDELLISTSDFQVYRYIPPSENIGE